MNYLNRIQNLPESERKIILWLTVAIIAVLLLFFWFRNFQSRIKNISGAEFKNKFQISENLKKLPKAEMPQIDKEVLKKIDEMMKQYNQSTTSTSTENTASTEK